MPPKTAVGHHIKTGFLTAFPEHDICLHPMQEAGPPQCLL